MSSVHRSRIELLKAVPEKYLAGLKGRDRAKRKKEIEQRSQGGGSRAPLHGDDKVKTKASQYSKTELASKVRERMKTNTTEAFLRAASHVSGVDTDLLRLVHERGAKAWESGHRAGASQVAWSRARVYSFLTGGKTQKTTDSDLWREHLERSRTTNDKPR